MQGSRRWGVLCLTSVIVPVVLILGCGGQKPPVEQRKIEPERPAPSAPPVPSNLHAKPTAQGFLLSWQTNRRPGEAISGYQVYLSPEKSIRHLAADAEEARGCLWQSAIYPGDLDPRTDVETAELDDVTPGVEYYLYVRTVGADGAIGAPSEEITIIPRVAGRITMVPRHVGETDGYSFAANGYVRARDERTDLYLFVRNDSVFAASPHRLDRYYRYVEFHELGPAASVDDYPTVEVIGKGESLIYLRVGFSYILSTPENCLAKLYVAHIEGSGGRTVVTMDYTYQPRCGVGVF